MKFKDFIEEKYIAGNRDKEWELMIKGCLPLSPSILKEFEIFIPKTYHVTDYKGMKNVIKLQGKRKDIATFTEGSEGIAEGALVDSEILFELEGYSSFSANNDFESVLDRNGHRWLNPLKDKSLFVHNKFKVPMNKAIIKEFGLKDRFEISSFVENSDGKGKARFIKFFNDYAKTLLNKAFMKELIKSIEKSYDDESDYNNNEILLHNFKIKSTKLIIDNDEDLTEPGELKDIMDGNSDIKVDGYILRYDIEDIGK